jgi:4-alpha-glucanotransferase
VRYKFRIGDDVEFGMNGVGCGGVRPWNLTVYAPEFRTPDWAAGAFIYQIFPDRFAPGGASFAKGVEYHRALGRNIEVHESWDEPVKYHPTTREYYYPDDFYGGTLEGIREKLPELRALGVRCLYLNPIFESASNHRYDTADFRQNRPHDGTVEDFTALCAAAAALGMHVVLDGVFSHTGDDRVYFTARTLPARRLAGGGVPVLRGMTSAVSGRLPLLVGFQEPPVRESDPDWQSSSSRRGQRDRRWCARAPGLRLDVADELRTASST